MCRFGTTRADKVGKGGVGGKEVSCRSERSGAVVGRDKVCQRITALCVRSSRFPASGDLRNKHDIVVYHLEYNVKSTCHVEASSTTLNMHSSFIPVWCACLQHKPSEVNTSRTVVCIVAGGHNLPLLVPDKQ